MVLALIAVIITGALLLISTLGGIGLTLGLFHGLKTIPPFVYILLGVIIVMWLLKGRR